MSPAGSPLATSEPTVELPAGWQRWVGPAVAALIGAAIVLAVIVVASPSTFELLGAGRGLIPEDFYPVWGYLLLLATVVGLVIGCVAGSALLFYVLTLAGQPSGWRTARLAMTLVYLALLPLPLLLYHALFGGWLLGMARTEVGAWLTEHYPDAHWLLVTAHVPIDLVLIPLALVFLVLLWGGGERTLRLRWAQTLLWLVVALSALAVALSLTIHSTLVHLRMS
jgi:hypothetical protein